MKAILRVGSRGDDVRVLQNKLNGLGFNVGLVDGIFGGKTDKAVKEIQYTFGLVADGIVGNRTYTLLDKLDRVKNFKLDEFRCRHCKKLKLNVDLLLKLEDLRSLLGNKAMVVNSGYRCPTHNANVGGIKTSEHLKGNAADINVVGINPDDVYRVADKLFDKGGVGRYNTFTHVDVGPNRYRWDKSTKKPMEPTPTPPPTKQVEPYTIRKFDTNIHVFETTSKMMVRTDLGVRWEREKVSKIVRDKLREGKNILLAINCGMFSYVPGSEHNTLYISEGLYFNPPSKETMDFIYYKDGTTKIVNIEGYDQARLNAIQADAHFGIGTSYSLVIDGEIAIRNAQYFPHAGKRNPRTQFGQRDDGTFVLAVTDGRVSGSLGLTAFQQASVMKELKCKNAVNVDGGGSSVMVKVVDGKIIIVNKLANGYEREVGSVMLVSLEV